MEKKKMRSGIFVKWFRLSDYFLSAKYFFNCLNRDVFIITITCDCDFGLSRDTEGHNAHDGLHVYCTALVSNLNFALELAGSVDSYGSRACVQSYGIYNCYGNLFHFKLILLMECK